MKYIITESRLNNIAIKWLNINYGDLKPFERNIYPNYVFFRKDDTNIFVYNKENGTVSISYGDIWSLLESMFDMEYAQIQDITKEWIEDHYNLEVSTTTRSKNPHL